MQGVLTAETAVLVHLETIGIVLLVLFRLVVSLLALTACQCDFNSHDGTSRFTENIIAFTKVKVNASLSEQWHKATDKRRST